MGQSQSSAVRRRAGRLGVAALLLLAGPTALAQRPPPSRAGETQVRVRDPQVAAEVLRRGGRLVQDYGGFQLFALSPRVVAQLPGGAERLDGHDLVLLNSGAIQTTAPVAGEAPVANAETVEGRRTHLVQLVGPTRPEWYRALLDTGVEVVSYVPHNAYLVYGDEASIGALRSLARPGSFVRWEGPHGPGQRLQPRRGARSPRAAPSARGAAADLYEIQLVRDPPANTATLDLIGASPAGEIRSDFELRGYRNVVGLLPPGVVNAVAARPDVVSIRPYAVPQRSGERQSRIVTGELGPSPGAGHLAFLAAKGFTQAQFDASGFAVDISDSGVDDGTLQPNHFGLYTLGDTTAPSRVVYNRLEGIPLFGDTLEGCDGHGTVNAHIVAGYNDRTGFPFTDADGFHTGLGVAPFVRVGASVIFAPGFIFPSFPDLHSRAYQDGARISSNSWGGVVNGAYDVQAQTFDALTRDAQPAGSAFAAAGNQEMVMIVAAGNEGPGGLRSPGTAKNVLSVGASEGVNPFGGADGCGVSDLGADDADDIADFSSGGPTTDQRIKPDIVAPGTHVSGGVFQTTTPGATGQADACFDGTGVCGGVGSSFAPSGQQFYTASSGTSHSTPAVAGGAALLRQYFINQALPTPSPAMTKAYLMNAARYLTGDFAGDHLFSARQGMGALDLGFAFDGESRILRDQLGADVFTSSGQTRTVTGTVADPGRPFRVTLAWTDAPGSTAGVAYNNDLDLTVTVGGQTYKGNVFTGAHSTPGGSADPRNNVESVFLPAGLSGDFAVTVTAANINSDGVPGSGGPLDQDFALVVYNADEVSLPVVAAGSAALVGESCGVGNGALDPGETVTVDLALRNLGSADTTDLVATLQATGGVVSPSGPESYGSLAAGGAEVARSFTFTADGTCGGVVTATLGLADGGLTLPPVSFDFDLGIQVPSGATTTLSNPENVFIQIGGPAAPYPSQIVASGLVGTVTGATVTLTGYTHTFSDDVDVLLVAPGGQSVVLMSDAGGGGVSNVTLTFDDAAATAVPDGSPLTSGTYRPANWEGSSTDSFTPPAPAGPYGTALADLAGSDPNGVWALYVSDDFYADGGNITGGWSVTIEISTPVCCSGGPAIAVSPTAGLVTTEAGGTASFDVVLGSVPAADVTVGISSSDTGEGTPSVAGVTFTPATALVPRTVTVAGVDDAVRDGDAAYSIVTAPAVSADPLYDGVDPADVSLTNVDDEQPELSIDDVAVAEGSSGTVDAVFTLTLSEPALGTESVDFATADGTATAGSDYVAISGTVGFAAGATTATLAVSVQGDLLDEDDETFSVDLSGAVDVAIADAQGLGTILDDDAPPAISIADVTVGEGDAGTTTAVFDVTLSGPSGQTVTVGFATSDGTALAGSDYLAASGTVSFAPGSVAETVGVGVVGDPVFEPDETFFVDLSAPVEATLGDAQALGTIASDDPQPSLAIDDVAVAEGDAGTADAVFTVTLSGPSSEVVSASWATADGTAVAGEDYAAASGSVSFAPGSVSETLSVSVSGDTSVEPDETFFVDLSAPLGATLGDARGQGSILSEEPPPLVSIDDVAVAEGDAGTTSAVFTLTLSAPSTESVSVSWSTADGTAVAGEDYAAASGSVSFAPGSVSETLTVSVSGDTSVEPSESFFVDLSAPVGAILADAQGEGTIVADDLPPPQSVVWTAGVGVLVSGADLTKTGGAGWNAGAVSVQQIASGDGYVEITASETNTYRMVGLSHGDDGQSFPDIDFALYLTGGASLSVYEGGINRGPVGTYATGDVLRVALEGGVVRYYRNGVLTYTSSGTPTYPLLADTSLHSPGATLTDATILSETQLQPVMAIGDVVVGEGDTGTTTATFAITLSGPSDGVVSASWATADGTATAGEDYTAASGSVSFAPGSLSETVSVSVTGDTSVEPDETFFVDLGAPVGATIGDARGQGTITADDVLPVLSIDDVEVTEGDAGTTSAVFTLSLSATSGETVSVSWATADGTAAAGEDYVAGSGSVSFAPGSLSETLSVDVTGDTAVESSETFFVDLSAPVGAALGDARGRARSPVTTCRPRRASSGPRASESSCRGTTSRRRAAPDGTPVPSRCSRSPRATATSRSR